MGCDRDRGATVSYGVAKTIGLARSSVAHQNYYHDNPLILLNILWSHRVKISSVRRVVTSFFLGKVLSGLI